MKLLRNVSPVTVELESPPMLSEGGTHSIFNETTGERTLILIAGKKKPIPGSLVGKVFKPFHMIMVDDIDFLLLLDNPDFMKLIHSHVFEVKDL